MLNYVNTRLGTYNDPRYSNGNIYPIVSMPFGMANFTLQTNGGSNWFYNPLSRSLEGIRLTHQPSPWVGDYGQLLILPFTGKITADKNLRWTSYRPNETTLMPHKMEVYLQRYQVKVKLAPTERGGCFAIDAVNGANASVAFITFAKSEFTVKGNVLSGWTDGNSYWNMCAREYFYCEFSSDVISTEAIEDGGIVVNLASSSVIMNMATSFISVEQAKRNFTQELSGKVYDTLVKENEAVWNDCLGSIEVSDENPERKKMFYSCLYRTFLYPRKFYEYDENGLPVHYNPDTKTCEKGVFYTDNGFWDTYRTVYPLLSIIRPQIVKEMIEGFVNYSEETGWLPKWLSPGEIGIMPGTLVEAVIADAAVKGIISGDLLERAKKYLVKNAYECGVGPHGRTGLADYLKYNYVPNDYRESVNHTCDCAYGDYCIAQVARLTGDDELAEKLLQRSKNYANLFDKEYGFLRSKDKNGNHRETFNPVTWGGDNCEGSSWQNSFAVYHDVEGLANLHGGKEALISKLDELFATPPVYEVSGYGQEIHEMSEMACVDFGQCAISNQPSFHIPWLYTMLGRRDKTEYWVEKLVNGAFFCEIDGFPGDEDNGTMAAWYIFACLGFYPVCPGKAEFVSAKPLFNKIKINGKDVVRNLPDIVAYNKITE